MSWPDGIFQGLHLDGRCRDLLTDGEGAPTVLAEETVHAVTVDRTLHAVRTAPDTPGISGLVGARAGGNLRGALQQVVPDLRDEARPRYLLLDDLAGASLIAGFAFLAWQDHLPELAEFRTRVKGVRSMQGVCSGFRPGASSLNADGTMSGLPQATVPVPPLAGAEDPWSFHDLGEHPPMAMRRARRIDVWREGMTVRVDAMFRDSCWLPDGTEVAVHEYSVEAVADAEDAVVTSVDAQPRVLPYDECPLAAANVCRVVGVPLVELRSEVLARLQSVDCCTHLNDALRALAEVPMLAQAIPTPSGV